MSAASFSLWDLTAAPLTPADPLAGADLDVAVVGGGYTGLATALFCAEAGQSVQVFEAGAIGQGGSGRNVGLVNAGLWLPPDEVSRNAGEAFLDRFGRGPDRVFDLIERHQIRCEATRAGTIHAAHSAKGQRDLAARHAGWRALGAPVELLDPEEVAGLTGSPRFYGGLLDRRAGTINPMGYARGLARAARDAGARVTTGCAVTGLAQAGEGWQIDTAQGTVRARNVVLASNAYSGALWPALSRSHVLIRFVQIATEPLAAPQILPEGQGLWDTAPIMTSLRRDAEGRLILGSMGALIGTAQKGITHDWARARLHRLFPDLGRVRFEAAWDGCIAMTPDHMPRIYRLAPGLWAPSGYNGRGITTGTLFGEALAAHLAGAPEDSLPLPVTTPAPLPLRAVQQPAYALAFAANQIWRGWRG